MANSSISPEIKSSTFMEHVTATLDYSVTN
jgi:hypothetical protein